MRTLSLLVLPAITAVAIACGGGNADMNPAVPTVDMSDSGMPSSMDTSMMDAGAMPSTDMAMDASMPSTDTSMAAMDAAAPDRHAHGRGQAGQEGQEEEVVLSSGSRRFFFSFA